MANVFLPASLAAARYVCNTEYTKVSNTAASTFAECCSQLGTASKYDYYSASTEHAESSCSIDQVCEEALTNEWSDTSVILPAAQQFAATPVSSVSSLIPFQKYSFNPLAVDSAVPFFKPSLFLLNSVFLN